MQQWANGKSLAGCGAGWEVEIQSIHWQGLVQIRQVACIHDKHAMLWMAAEVMVSTWEIDTSDQFC